MASVSWEEVEPWLDDMSEWLDISTKRARPVVGHPFSTWQLTVTIQSDAETSCFDPKELTIRLREVIEMLKLSAMCADRALWGQIVKRITEVSESPWAGDKASQCLLTRVWLRFECGASLENINCLESFVTEFFLPLNELQLSLDGRDILARLSTGSSNEDAELLTHARLIEWARPTKRSRDHCAWACRMCFGTLNNSRGKWTEAMTGKYLDWILDTTWMVDEKLRNAVQLGDDRLIRRETQIHARDLPLTHDLMDVLPLIFAVTKVRLATMSWSRSCCGEHANQDELFLSYGWDLYRQREYRYYLYRVPSYSIKATLSARIHSPAQETLKFRVYEAVI